MCVCCSVFRSKLHLRIVVCSVIERSKFNVWLLSLHTIRRRFMVVEGLGLESHSNSGSWFVASPVQSLRVQGDSRLRGKRLGASPAQRMRLQGDSKLEFVCW